jgi:hypothetical protein
MYFTEHGNVLVADVYRFYETLCYQMIRNKFLKFITQYVAIPVPVLLISNFQLMKFVCKS